MMSSPSPEGAEIFADWTLYDRVIHYNYMQHREMAQAIGSIARTLSQPLHVLDLGCGDGRMAGEGLREMPVASYTGVDLSPAALEAARARLEHLDCSIELKHSDLAAALEAPIEPAPNLILASYSLHHYRPEQMAELIARLEDVLAPGGVFVWIDIERRERESRDEFLARFYQHQLTTWKAIDNPDIEDVRSHMAEADFPLTAAEKREFTQLAGLRWHSSPPADDIYVAHIFLEAN